MTPPLLSASLIVRNEAHHLDACLSSIRDLVDEIVVVDTGSTDGTVDLARGFGAHVHPYPWHDDFAAARNHGLERCVGRWVLYIDADERVRPVEKGALVAALSDEDAVGCSVLLHARPGHTAYPEMRLFRNHALIRFRGLIHETIWPGIHAYMDAHGGRLGTSPLVMDHVGYEGDQAHKHARNLPLLEEALARDPDLIYCWCHLGLTYLALDRREDALEAWRSGVEAVRRNRRLRPADSLVFIELVHDGLAHGEDVAGWLAEGRRTFPDDAMLEWLDAQADLQAGRLDEAIATFTRLADAWAAGRLSRHVAHPETWFTARTFAAIGHAQFALERFDDALRSFARAEAADPDNPEYRAKRLLCAHRAGVIS